MSQKSLRQIIAANIRKIRDKRGLTQEETSEKAGFHYKYYQRVESGSVNLTLDSIEKLAKALQFKPEKIFVKG